MEIIQRRDCPQAFYMWHSIIAYNAFYKIERVSDEEEVNVNGISLY